MERFITIGQVVIYKLSDVDVERIIHRRNTEITIAESLSENRWSKVTQAHIGNWVGVGEEYPLIVTRTFERTDGIFGVNGQVLLDGNDVLWVTSVKEGNDPGQWHITSSIRQINPGEDQ